LNADCKRIQTQIHRGIPRQHRNRITQVMESIVEVQFWAHILKTIGNTEKSIMKMGQNLDPQLNE